MMTKEYISITAKELRPGYILVIGTEEWVVTDFPKKMDDGYLSIPLEGYITQLVLLPDSEVICIAESEGNY